MNYIEQLQNEIKELKEKQSKTITGLKEINRYVNSNKFNCGDKLDGYVNISDINIRIMNILNEL